MKIEVKMIELFLDWEYSKMLYIGFPMSSWLEVFPFWAIKLYLLSDPDSEKDENVGGEWLHIKSLTTSEDLPEI